MLPAGYLFYHFSRMVRHTYLWQRPLPLHFCLLLLLHPPGRRPRITSAVHRQSLPVLLLPQRHGSRSVDRQARPDSRL